MGLFGSKPRPVQPDHRLTMLAHHVDEAELRYLDVLRREVANAIIVLDPNLMERSYSRARTYERELDGPGGAERQAADLAALQAKFPVYDEFDLLSIRHCLPYAVATRDMWPDQLVERYLDISRMMVILRRLAETKRAPLHDEQEAETLRREMRRERDRRMVVRIDEAMRIYRAFNAGVHSVEQDLFADHDYGDLTLEVRRIDREAYGDIVYGIHFRTTNEFCVLCLGMGDGPSIQSYYRADQKYSNREAISTF